MRQRLLIVITCLCSSTCFAQETVTKYFDNEWNPSDLSSAMYYRTYTKTNNLYKAEDHKIDGKMIVSGFTDTITDNIDAHRQGHYIYFTAWGNKIKEGDFTNGVQNGIWKTYIRDTNAIQEEIEYVYGRIIKKKEFDKETKKIIIEEVFNDSAGNNKSTLTHYSYYSNGNIKNITTQSNVTVTNAICYSITGAQIECDSAGKSQKVFFYIEQAPYPGYDLAKYFSKNIKYPTSAISGKEEGKVLVKFTIYEDGSVHEVEIEESVSDAIDKEALRLISAMPNWHPGTQNGKNVKVRFTQSISFVLPH